MNRPVQYSVRFLLIAILMVASFFGGIAFQKREVNQMRSAVMEQKEADAKRAAQFREMVDQLMAAQKRIKELEAGGRVPDGPAPGTQ